MFLEMKLNACALWLQIQEIVTTGKLSKLEHFETDEKVCSYYVLSLVMCKSFHCSVWVSPFCLNNSIRIA